jgi:acyl-CoA thioester hydrolase
VRHHFDAPMRWADLDQLGHVNNVIFVDYLQEARVDMLRVHAPDARAGQLADGVVVVRHSVSFETPLTFSSGSVHRQSVQIESWITEIRAASFTIAYEVVTGAGEERVTFARASTVLTPYVFATGRPRRITPEERIGLERYLEPSAPAPRRQPSARVETEHGHYPAHVRFSDVDAYGHVNNVKYFEYLQEARIALLAGLWSRLAPAGQVPQLLVSHTEVDYRVPLLFRSRPYDVWTWITEVDERSVVIDAEICDGPEVAARARNVLVAFDPATGRGRPLPEPVRSVLAQGSSAAS